MAEVKTERSMLTGVAAELTKYTSKYVSKPVAAAREYVAEKRAAAGYERRKAAWEEAEKEYKLFKEGQKGYAALEERRKSGKAGYPPLHAIAGVFSVKKRMGSIGPYAKGLLIKAATTALKEGNYLIVEDAYDLTDDKTYINMLKNEKERLEKLETRNPTQKAELEKALKSILRKSEE